MTEREAQQPLRVVRGVLPVVGTVLAVSVSSFSTVASAQDSAAHGRAQRSQGGRHPLGRSPSAGAGLAVGSGLGLRRNRAPRAPLGEAAGRLRREAGLSRRARDRRDADCLRRLVWQRTTGDRDHGRVRRAARAVTEGAAQQGATGRGRRWSWLRAQHVWRRESRRRARDQGADPVGQRSRARFVSTARRPRRTSAARPTWRATACSTTST